MNVLARLSVLPENDAAHPRPIGAHAVVDGSGALRAVLRVQPPRMPHVIAIHLLRPLRHCARLELARPRREVQAAAAMERLHIKEEKTL